MTFNNKCKRCDKDNPEYCWSCLIKTINDTCKAMTEMITDDISR